MAVKTWVSRLSNHPNLLWLSALPVMVALPVIGVSWWLTAPVSTPTRSESIATSNLKSTDDKPTDEAFPTCCEADVSSRGVLFASLEGSDADGSDPWAGSKRASESNKETLAWPEERLEGMAAKRLLLEILYVARERLDQIDAYTAVLRRQERIDGKLRPEQTLSLKLRHEPFSLYLKFLEPSEGREVLFVDGQHDNKALIHNGDWTRRFLPRVPVDPHGPIALSEARHPITEAGLSKLVDKLIHYRKLDLKDSSAVTILDKVNDDGKTWYRASHTHPLDRSDERPFHHVQVLINPETWLPEQIVCYDWPEPGQEDKPVVGERYHYENLNLEAALTDQDFDPSNDEYKFRRY